jgi:hypothetical protein
MKTFNSKLWAFRGSAGKQGKAVPAMSGSVYPFQRHKIMSNSLLYENPFCRTNKTGQAIFHLSKIARMLYEIIY